jgi:hypothetical protein
MRWEEIDERFPKPTFPSIDPRSRWAQRARKQRAYLDALLACFARGAVGLDAGTLDPATARSVIDTAYYDAPALFGDSAQDEEYGKSVCALLAAALADFQLVTTCTGGKTLGLKVQKTKIYRRSSDGHHDLRGLARHLATAARAKLPPSHAFAAMVPLREDFVADKLADPRVALVAAYAFFAHVAVLPADELRAACRAWLDGKPLDLHDGPALAAVADGEDPRTKIFERFAASLTSERTIAHYREEFEESSSYRSDYDVFVPEHTSDAVTFLYVARQPLPQGWEARVDPHVVRWLGGEVGDAALAARRREMVASNKASRDPKRVRANVVNQLNVDPAIRALLVGDSKLLAAYTGGGELSTFKPGKFFKDDWKKLVRYLGAAVQSKRSARADVEPAWFDYLSREQTIRVSWSNLLALQAIITVEIAGGDANTVGRDLQRVVTGA